MKLWNLIMLFYFLFLTGIVSLISLAMLSYDRYSTLTVHRKGGLDFRKPLLAVGGSWLYSLLWTVPPLLGWSSYGLEGAGTGCSVSWTTRTLLSHSYIICLFIFCLLLPVSLMVYCYSRLLCVVRQVSRDLLALAPAILWVRGGDGRTLPVFRKFLVQILHLTTWICVWVRPLSKALNTRWCREWLIILSQL